MILIQKSGYFAPHPELDMFGQIHFSNGDVSDILVTKRHALEFAEILVGISITDEEWLIIRQQIHASKLVDNNQELEEFVNGAQTFFSELKNLHGTIMREQKKSDWWKEES